MLSFCPRGVLDEILNLVESVSEGFPSYSCLPLRGLTSGFLLHGNFSVAISASPYVCSVLVLILMSMFLR